MQQCHYLLINATVALVTLSGEGCKSRENDSSRTRLHTPPGCIFRPGGQCSAAPRHRAHGLAIARDDAKVERQAEPKLSKAHRLLRTFVKAAVAEALLGADAAGYVLLGEAVCPPNEPQCIDALGGCYGLTRSESVVVLGLCRGQSVAEIAELRGTTRHVVGPRDGSPRHSQPVGEFAGIDSKTASTA